MAGASKIPRPHPTKPHTLTISFALHQHSALTIYASCERRAVVEASLDECKKNKKF
jgi:hypothetical protein